jgi:hypothetical protein
MNGTLRDLFREDLVTAAGLDPRAVKSILVQLNSTSPGFSQATAHALLVYLSWWKRWMA